MSDSGILAPLRNFIVTLRQHLSKAPPAPDPSLLSEKEIEGAIEDAERAVAAAIRAGARARPSDLLLLQHLERPKTPLSRLREARFPLFVVIVSLAVLAIAATAKPPVTAVVGNAEARAIAIEGLASSAPDVLQVFAAGGSNVSVFGLTLLDSAVCALGQPETGLKLLAERVVLPLYLTETLRLERTRAAPRQTGELPTQTLSIAATFSADEPVILDAFGVTEAGPLGADPVCTGVGKLSLRASNKNADLTVAAIPQGALWGAIVIPGLSASSANFARFGAGSGPEICALTTAHLKQAQEIPLLGLAPISETELSEGTCMGLAEGSWRFTILAEDDTFRIRFQSSSRRPVVNIDDGIPASETALTYLEIISADPGLGLILGGVAYVLTTIWGAAVLIKRVVS
ncbi:hypothetical protein DXV76_19945 [Rhodobacteraceae bacterium CCMM004]|nr:hypothetical protein DXV76_19945 [Rhodobacteraceae bacterium CCMM004]